MDRGSLSDVIHGWRDMEYGEDLMAAVTFQVPCLNFPQSYPKSIYILEAWVTSGCCYHYGNDQKTDPTPDGVCLSPGRCPACTQHVSILAVGF